MHYVHDMHVQTHTHLSNSTLQSFLLYDIVYWFYANVSIYQLQHLPYSVSWYGVTSRFFSFTLALITEQDAFELFKLYLGRNLNKRRLRFHYSGAAGINKDPTSFVMPRFLIIYFSWQISIVTAAEQLGSLIKHKGSNSTCYWMSFWLPRNGNTCRCILCYKV